MLLPLWPTFASFITSLSSPPALFVRLSSVSSSSSSSTTDQENSSTNGSNSNNGFSRHQPKVKVSFRAFSASVCLHSVGVATARLADCLYLCPSLCVCVFALFSFYWCENRQRLRRQQKSCVREFGGGGCGARSSLRRSSGSSDRWWWCSKAEEEVDEVVLKCCIFTISNCQHQHQHHHQHHLTSFSTL